MGRRQEEQWKLNAAQTSLDDQQKREGLQSHYMLSCVPDQNHFLTCLIYTHSPGKHPKEKSYGFYLEPETVL